MTQILKLDGDSLPTITADALIYLIRPKLHLIKMVCSSIEKIANSLNSKEIHVLFMPRRVAMYEKVLTNFLTFNPIKSIEEYPIQLFPVDSDLVSMELDSSFKEIFCDKDYTCLYHVAKAIMSIQSMYGMISNIYGQGPIAKRVYDLLMRMRKELDPDQELSVFPQINYLLLIDRSVDLISPLMTQLNYEGLLDEIFGIENSSIKLPQELFKKKSPQDSKLSSSSSSETDGQPKIKQLKLNSSDELFGKIRDKTFYEVGPIIKERCDYLSARYDERHQAKTITEIKQFVENLSIMEVARASIANQIPAAELVKETVESEAFIQLSEAEEEIITATDNDKINPYIEDCIGRQEPLLKILRLICLQSLVNNGLKAKVLSYYTSGIIQTYGFNQLIFLNNLTKAGLLKEKTSYSSKGFNMLKKSFKLIPEKLSDVSHRDISYVFNGYAPLSVRLAENLISPGWKAISDALKLLPEPTIETVQQLPSGLKRRNSGSSVHSCEDQKVILVFFIGGITYAEISALRLLSQKEEGNTEFVIATTNFINGKTFLSSLNELNFEK